MVNLYFECTSKPPRIVDDAGIEYTPARARALFDAGLVADFNLAFARLHAHNFDIDAALKSIDSK